MLFAEKPDRPVFDASGWHIGIVVADFNDQITGSLLDSALARAERYDIPKKNIEVVHVAGAVEIPLVLQELARTGAYDALLAIGCVIQGETPHFDYVCRFVTDGVLRVQLDEHMPIGFGVLTVHDEAQAQARRQLGGDHLDAVLDVARLLRERGLSSLTF